MSNRFIQYLKAQVGCIYVWGAQGETDISEAWIREMETSEKNAERAIALWKQRQGKATLAAYDCSGLIVKYLLDEGIIKSDMSSRGLFRACAEVAGRSELQPCDFVFRHNGSSIHHVGVYIGDGMVIESKGRDDGVVMRPLNASGSGYWNRYGRFEPLVSALEKEQIVEESGEEIHLPALYSYFGATYVNLRSGASTDCQIIGRVSRGDTVLLLAFENGWAEVIAKNDKVYRRGWCTAKYLTRKE